MMTKTISGIVTDPIYIGRKGENLSTEIYFDVPTDLADYAYTVYMKRPKEREAYACAYAVKDGDYIVWTVSNVDTAITGNGEVQIRFTEDETVIKTMVYPVQIGRAIDVETTDAPEWYDTWLDALTALAETTTENAEAAAESATNAATSETNAANSASAAATSEANAAESEDNAADSEANAKTSEENASDSEENAEAWAVGQRSGVDVESTDETYENNAKYYAELSASSGGFAWFSVDNETGELTATVTDSLAEDVTFAVNTTDGTLEVTVA